MPKYVDLIVGHTCNNRCLHCFMEMTIKRLKENEEPFDKTLSQLKNSIEKHAKDNYETITFTGGEATIRADFLELARYVKTQGMSVSIQSNGRAFADIDFTKKIMKIEPDLSVLIPIHSHNEDIHDKITQVKGSFKQTVSGIKNLVESGCKNINLMTVVYCLNYKDLENIVEFVEKIGCKRINMSAPQMEGNPYIDWKKMAVSHSKIAPYLKNAIGRGIVLGIDVKYDAIPFCFMKGYEKYNSDIEISIIPYIKGDESIREDKKKESVIFDLEIGRHTKPKVCKSCKYYNVCMGVWKRYPVIFGVSEFKALPGDKITNTKEFIENVGAQIN